MSTNRKKIAVLNIREEPNRVRGKLYTRYRITPSKDDIELLKESPSGVFELEGNQLVLYKVVE